MYIIYFFARIYIYIYNFFFPSEHLDLMVKPPQISTKRSPAEFHLYQSTYIGGSKFLAIWYHKSHFIYFNLPFYNSLHIHVYQKNKKKGLIFTSKLNTIYLFINFFLSSSLSLYLSLPSIHSHSLAPSTITTTTNRSTTTNSATINKTHSSTINKPHSLTKLIHQPSIKLKLIHQKIKPINILLVFYLGCDFFFYILLVFLMLFQYLYILF